MAYRVTSGNPGYNIARKFGPFLLLLHSVRSEIVIQRAIVRTSGVGEQERDSQIR